MMKRPSDISKMKSWIGLLLLIFSLEHLPLIRSYKFALVPKHLNSIFFDVSRDGCLDRAKFLTGQQDGMEVECIYTGPLKFNPDGLEQAAVVRELIERGDIDGLSISVLNAETMRPVIQEAVAKGIPVVTFDSDDPDSGRASYIGTDNFFFGEQLGKVVQQIRPQGGTYVIVGDETPNIVARENGVRASLQQESKTDWKELSISPLDAQGNYSFAIDIMRDALRNNNITAVIPTFGGPMFLGQKWADLVDEFPEVIFVVADGLQVQLDFLARGKVSGLVAQLPYNMGSMSMDSLLVLKTAGLAGLQGLLPDFQGTNVLEHVMVPLILPELTVNQNLLGGLRYVGFILFGIIALTSLLFLGWTIVNRSVRVVQAAQPGFLALVAIGVLIMGASIIPLSFDDSAPDYTQEMGDFRCMAIPWLLFIGFTLIFAALFAKLWRINRLFQSSARFKRVTLKTKDVIIPMAALLISNVAALTWWTLTDPLKYRRLDLQGTDAWNRVIATWGGCMSEDPLPYSLVIGFLNVGVMLVASWQAYRARKIESEFAESKYVGMALASMIQVSLIGMPLLLLVRTDPRAWYWTLSLGVFIICMVVLLVIFIPKMRHFRRHAVMGDASQQLVLAESIKKTQDKMNDTQRGSQIGSGHPQSNRIRNPAAEYSIPNRTTNHSVQSDSPLYLSADENSADASECVPSHTEEPRDSRLMLQPGGIKDYLGQTRPSSNSGSAHVTFSALKEKDESGARWLHGDRAKFLTGGQADVVSQVECVYAAPLENNPNGLEQAAIVRELIERGDIDGLSISVLNAETMRPVIQEAVAKGIPVVTFDSDDPDSGRASYIGTDNFFFGEQLGKVVQQIQPQGGTYVIVADQSPNLIARENGVRASLQQESKTDWKELSISPLNYQGNYSFAIDIMRDTLRNNNITAVIPVLGGPMFLGQKWGDLVDEFPEVIFVVADGLQVQLDFLARGKVAGLVAQLPYNMGSMSMDSLLVLKTAALIGQQAVLPDFQGTNVLEHVMVPLILPELTVNQNLLGDLRYVGFVLCGIVTLTSFFCLGWTIVNRSVRVVQAAQPSLLSLVAIGVFIMGAALVPLGFDDSVPDYTQEMGDLRCMSIPWLLFIGFTMIFAALFAKLWRINRLFQSSAQFKRVTLTTRDVMIPMAALLVSNVAALTWWTLTDPLKYRRLDLQGTDAWNRVIATWGGCMSNHPLRYSLVLGFLNLGVMLVASWQAYRARKIESAFAESKYVAMALASMIQLSLIGMPLLLLVRTDPRAWYWTLSLGVFIICMVVLLVIFIPKMRHFRRHALLGDASQRRVLAGAIKKTQDKMSEHQREKESSASRHSQSDRDYGFGHEYSTPNNSTEESRVRFQAGGIKDYLGQNRSLSSGSLSTVQETDESEALTERSLDRPPP